MSSEPKPTWAPPLMALGLMCTLWGAATSWIVTAIGIVAVGVAATRWIRDIREG